MKEQTAMTDLFHSILNESLDIDDLKTSGLMQYYLEMEKEQIIDAYLECDCVYSGLEISENCDEAEQYYNSTYKQD